MVVEKLSAELQHSHTRPAAQLTTPRLGAVRAGGPGHRGQPRPGRLSPEYAELATASGAVTRRSRRQPATDM